MKADSSSKSTDARSSPAAIGWSPTVTKLTSIPQADHHDITAFCFYHVAPNLDIDWDMDWIRLGRMTVIPVLISNHCITVDAFSQIMIYGRLTIPVVRD